MAFSDASFLFGFLPAVVLIALIAGKISSRTVGLALAAASFGFYAAWRVENIPLLAASVAINYGLGQRLLVRPSRPLLALAIGLNLAVLGFYKYSGFAVLNFNFLFGEQFAFQAPVLPLAISFFTFQQIAYLVDSYRRQVDAHGFLDYVLFVTFFPHLIAGPLVQPRDMLHQWRDNDLSPKLGNIAVGLTVLIIGLFKKLVLADSLAGAVDSIFSRSAEPGALSMLEALLGTVGFSWQIYFDFSGYTDMAVGMAWFFGVRLPVNFSSPYRASSIIEFWQRWHMTLSRFLRQYLYFPLGGARRGRTRQMANIMTVMLLGGLWHGASWTFVLWGGLHGAAIVCNHAWRDISANWRWPKTALFNAAATALTFMVVLTAWILFRANSWSSAENIMLTLIGQSGTFFPNAPFPLDWASAKHAAGPFLITYGNALLALSVGAIVIFFMPNVQTFMRTADLWIFDKPREQSRSALQWRLSPAWGFITGAILFVALLSIWRIQTRPLFIYFEF